jgi:putative acyl-CoA dehydrogenase
VALAKYSINKRCPGVIAEAMEVLGGAGYVEESPLPLLYREAPLNAIWEGSGNVICLDVLRTLQREPAAFEALRTELDAARGADRRYDAVLDAALARWPKAPPEAEARWFTECLARLLETALMLRHAPEPVASAYAATRLDTARGQTAGALPAGLNAVAVLARITDAMDLG